jgi:hypothetical protein
MFNVHYITKSYRRLWFPVFPLISSVSAWTSCLYEQVSTFSGIHIIISLQSEYIIASTVIPQITRQLCLWKLGHLSEHALCQANFPTKNNVKGGSRVFGCNFTLLFYSVTAFDVYYVSACIRVQRRMQICMFICMYQYTIIRK